MMTSNERHEVESLAKDVMDIVLQVAAKRLAQSLETVHETHIEPLRDAVRAAITPFASTLSHSDALERLKAINNAAYHVLENKG